MKGFIIGLALTIIVGQLPKLFGFEKVRGQLLRAGGGLSATSWDERDGRSLVGLVSLAS